MNDIEAVILGIGANGLGAVRGLAYKNIKTSLIAFDEKDIGLKSRYPTLKIALSAGTFNDKKIELFGHLNQLKPGCVVIPTSDWFVSVLAEYSQQHQGRIKACLPQQELAEKLIDKAQETALLAAVADIPKTVQSLPSNASNLLEQLRLPIIFKPRSYSRSYLGRKNIQVRNRKELEDFYQQFGDHLDDTIAQEIIPGEDDCLWVCNCTFDEAYELSSAFVFRRLSLSPSHYGVTSYARSESNATLLDIVRNIGAHLKYTGPAMIEFKYDHRDKQYKYIEINPRLGLCNFFDTRCGINNVYQCYKLALNEATELSLSQKDGVIFTSAFEDLYARRKDGQSLVSILQTYVADALKPHVFIYFCLDDLLPGLVMFQRGLSAFFNSSYRKILGRK